MIGRAAAVAGTIVLAVLILAITTVGALIGLNAECNGAASECPRSTAYRVTLISAPIAVLVILTAGGIISARRRSPAPLLMTCGGVIVLNFFVSALLRS